MRVEKPVHLYWVTVPDDPSEDWFVFATQAHLARAFFEDYEGLGSREAEVRLVERDVRLNRFEFGERPCWAHLSDLEGLDSKSKVVLRISGPFAKAEKPS